MVVARRVAREVAHQEEGYGLAVLGLPHIEPVGDLAQAREDLTPASRLLVDLAKCRLLGRLPSLDVSFGQRPYARRLAAADQEGIVVRIPAAQQQSAGRYLVL